MWAGVEYKNEPFVDSFSLVCLTIWKKGEFWEDWPFKFIVWNNFNNVVGGGLSGAIDKDELSTRIEG